MRMLYAHFSFTFFSSFPHGVISYGVFCNFGLPMTGFAEIFPGINMRVLTLQANFYFPFRREFFLLMGGF